MQESKWSFTALTENGNSVTIGINTEGYICLSIMRIDTGIMTIIGPAAAVFLSEKLAEAVKRAATYKQKVSSHIQAHFHHPANWPQGHPREACDMHYCGSMSIPFPGVPSPVNVVPAKEGSPKD